MSMSSIHITHHLKAYHCSTNIHTGFQIVPAVSREPDDRLRWRSFLAEVEQFFQDDDQVEAEPDYIRFGRETSLRLPFLGHQFLRFSSTINDETNVDTRGYIDTVADIARAQFGLRVQAWNHKFCLSIRSSNAADLLAIHQEV